MHRRDPAKWTARQPRLGSLRVRLEVLRDGSKPVLRLDPIFVSLEHRERACRDVELQRDRHGIHLADIDAFSGRATDNSVFLHPLPLGLAPWLRAPKLAIVRPPQPADVVRVVSVRIGLPAREADTKGEPRRVVILAMLVEFELRRLW